MKRFFNPLRVRTQAALFGVGVVLAFLVHVSVCVAIDSHDIQNAARTVDRSLHLSASETKCGFLGADSGCGKKNATAKTKTAVRTAAYTPILLDVECVGAAHAFGNEAVHGRNSALAHRKLTTFLI